MTNAGKRNADLKRMLIERRREMQDEVQRRIRDGRTDGRRKYVTTSNIPTPTSKATSNWRCSR